MAKRKPMSKAQLMTPKTRYRPDPASIPIGTSMYGGTMDIPGAWQSIAKPAKNKAKQQEMKLMKRMGVR